KALKSKSKAMKSNPKAFASKSTAVASNPKALKSEFKESDSELQPPIVSERLLLMPHEFQKASPQPFHLRQSALRMHCPACHCRSSVVDCFLFDFCCSFS